MTWEAWLTLLVVLGMLLALARNLAPTDAIMLGGLTLLAPLSTISDRFPKAAELVQAFGNESVATIAALFVLTAGLSATGAAQSVSQHLLGRPKSIAAAQLRLMVPVVALSAFINNTPVVATLLPVVKEWAHVTKHSPTKLLLPLSYAAVLGGTCTLIGTSTNLVVQGLLLGSHLPAMGMFTLTPVGVPIAVAGLLLILLVSQLLLPDRSQEAPAQRDPRQYTAVMRVRPGGPIVGRSIEEAGLRHLGGLFLGEVERSGLHIPAVAPDFVLQASDVLTFVGLVKSVADLQRISGLEPATDDVHLLDTPRTVRCFAEAVVSPTSPLIGQSIRDSGFRSRYDAVVIAVHRNGEQIQEKIGDVVIHRGDTLLLETRDQFVERYRNESDFLVVSKLDGEVSLRHDKSARAISILLAVVIGAALEPVTGIGILPLAMVGSLAMLIGQCCTLAQAKRGMEWSVLLSIGAALGIAKALTSTGAADAIATTLIEPLGEFGPRAALAGVYLVTLLLTELITNNAAAALAFPVALSTAFQLGCSPMPYVIAVTLAASSGYATPMGYQTHMMVHSAGGYLFADFMRIGIAMDALCMMVAVALIPIFFPF